MMLVKMRSISTREKLGPVFIRNFSVSNTQSAGFRAERPSDIRSLTAPIGQREAPNRNDNSGIDERDLQQKWKDFTDPQKNRARREELKKEFAKTTHSHIYGFRHTGGKFFTSPKAPFNVSESLYMPNFVGQTLDGNDTSLTMLLGNRPSIVRIFSSDISQKQINSFTQDLDFDALNWNMIDINAPTSWVNEKLVKLFSSSIKKSLEGSHHKYLISRRGITPELRTMLWADNLLGGFLYVVDTDYKIRWAGSGVASDAEKNLLRKIVQHLKVSDSGKQ